jgi:hypothetical protein
MNLIKDMPEWAKEWANKRISNLGYVPSEEEVLYIKDYLVAYQYEDAKIIDKLYKMRWDDVLEKSLKWHEKLAEKRLKVYSFGGHADDINEVMSFSNGFKVVKVTSIKGLDFEGNAMGHCVGQGGYDDLDRVTIFSLRDKDNMPHATIEYIPQDKEVYQIQGRANGSVIKKYLPMLKSFLIHLEPKSFNSYYISKNDFNLCWGNPFSLENKNNKLYDLDDHENLPDVLYHKGWDRNYNGSSIIRKLEHNNEYVIVSETLGDKIWKIEGISSKNALDYFEGFMKKYKPSHVENSVEFGFFTSDKKNDMNVYNMASIDLPEKIQIHENRLFFPVISDNVNYGYIEYLKEGFHKRKTLNFHTQFTHDSIDKINAILRKHNFLKNAEINVPKNKNYVFGFKETKAPLQIYHISNMPKYIYGHFISISEQNDNIVFPTKLQFIEYNKFKQKIERPDKIEINISKCKGNIMMPEKFMNISCDILIVDCSGEIYLKENFDNVEKLNMHNSPNVKSVPKYTNIPNFVFIDFNNKKHKGLQSIQDSLNEIKRIQGLSEHERKIEMFRERLANKF